MIDIFEINAHKQQARGKTFHWIVQVIIDRFQKNKFFWKNLKLFFNLELRNYIEIALFLSADNFSQISHSRNSLSKLEKVEQVQYKILVCLEIVSEVNFQLKYVTFSSNLNFYRRRIAWDLTPTLSGQRDYD